jgi:hypothetical protein
LEFTRLKEEEREVAVTWDATTFVTYQVNAIGLKGFKPMKVLFDNQANISIIRPKLLSAFEEAENGGVQLKTKKTGYLPDFFHVYSSSDTKAKVLSFADVEDLYKVTYQPQESFLRCTYRTEISLVFPVQEISCT